MALTSQIRDLPFIAKASSGISNPHMPDTRLEADISCMPLQINQFVYIDKMVNTSAFTYFSQIRVLNEETAYISPTNGVHCCLLCVLVTKGLPVLPLLCGFESRPGPKSLLRTLQH